MRNSRSRSACFRLAEAYARDCSRSTTGFSSVTKVTRGVPEIGGNDRLFLKRKKRPDYAAGRGSVRVVDLFAGCGGLTLGIAVACRALALRLDVRLAVEAVQDTWGVYAANFADAPPSRA